MLGIGWQDGVATIVDRRLVGQKTEPDTGEFANQSVEVYEFIADVRSEDGSVHFRAPLKEPFNAITFKPPQVGQLVKVKFHEKDKKVKFDRDDDGTYQHVPGVPDWRLHKNPLKESDEDAVAADNTSNAQARWEAQLNDLPGTAPAAEVELGGAGISAQNEARVAPSGRSASMAELVELRKKLDRGEITEAEYEAARAAGPGGGPAGTAP